MNRLLTFFLLSFPILSLSAQTYPALEGDSLTDGQKKSKVAVVLSGGGAKGMAHIGVLKVLEKAGIPVDIVTGTSMGSIIGGLYSAGYRADNLSRLVGEQDWTFVLSDKEDPRTESLYNRKKQNTYFLSKTLSTTDNGKIVGVGGFIEGKNLKTLFGKLTKRYPDSISFDSLPIPFACVATNIVDNTEYVYRSGKLAEAMRASMSIPGAFAPVRKGDMVLVDGGLKNNYPVDVARDMGADYVIGVTLQSKPRTADDIMASGNVLGQIVDINCKNKYDGNVALTDIHIAVDTEGYSTMSFTETAIDSLIKRGEQAAMRHWDAIIALKERLRMAADEPMASSEMSASQSPDAVSVQDSASVQMARTQMRASLGVRFDTEELVALQVNDEIHPKTSPLWLDATLRLGKRIMGRLDANFNPVGMTKMRFSYIFRRNDMHVNEEGSRAYNIVFNQHTLDVSLLDFNIRNFNVNIGAKWDYYNYNSFLVGTHLQNVPSSQDSEDYFIYYANIGYNSENKWYFPERGACFDAGYSYVNDNLLGYKKHVGISLINAMWRMSFPLTPRLTLQPMAYGRLIFGTDIPYSLHNVVGGDEFGRYLEQQMPFAGMGYIERADKQFVALRLRLQQRIADNNYVLASIVGAQQADRMRKILHNGPMMGYQIAYFYNTMFGPLGATLGYSNRTDKPYFYMNLGFNF